MNDRDWELEFEDFDWNEKESDAVTEDESVADDDEFAVLFQSLEDVRANEELRASTLGAILSSENENLRLRDSNGARKGRRSHMRRPSRMRVAVLAACFVVIVAGALSWFMPVTSVAVTQDSLSVVLGVNIYGITVSTSGSGELNERIVADAKATNQSLTDSLRSILDAYDAIREERGETGLNKVTVAVSGAIGFSTEGIRQEAQRVLENRSNMLASEIPSNGQGSANEPTGGDARTGVPGESQQSPGQQSQNTGAQVGPSTEVRQQDDGYGNQQRDASQQPVQEQMQQPTGIDQEPSMQASPSEGGAMDWGYSQDEGIHGMGTTDAGARTGMDDGISGGEMAQNPSAL